MLTQQLGRAIGKLRNLVAEKGGLASAAHIRTVLLHRLHERISHIFDRGSEAVSTRGKRELGELTIASGNVDQGVHYLPTPRAVFHWLHKLLPSDRHNWSFIDVGAGSGRVVLMAARYPYRRVAGIEFAQELVQTARRNIAFQTEENIAAEKVDILHCDATDFPIPRGACVFFLFNPFGDRVLTKFLMNLQKSHESDPRRMVFMYVNPAHSDVLAKFGFLQKRKLGAWMNFKLRALSPYGAEFYATAEVGR